MKRILTGLLAAMMLLSFTACRHNEPNKPTEPETTPVTTPPAQEPEHFNLNEIDLDGIGTLLAERQQDGYSKIRLDGLCTPVFLELQGTDLLSISAYGTTATVDTAAAEYSSIYGNLWPVIYEQDGLIFLNIWHDDIGYTCVLCPDGSYMETYPDKEYSVMIYVDEEGQMVQYQFARKFQGISQWETAPIDMATSRDDFYYSIDNASWTEGEYTVTAGESYTISDWYALDEIFQNAKAEGLYPDFDTLDALLAYNATEKDSTGEGEGPDSTREEISFFDELFAAYDYDSQKNLVTETFYERFFGDYFTKTHTYDEKNRDIAGVWRFNGEEAYRYTNAYDSSDRLTEVRWYQADREVERFTYTYPSQGGHTETFFQYGEKKYTCTFDQNGDLTGHCVYEDGKTIQTGDVKSLVKTELLTDIWFPFMDNEALHFEHHYNGTVPLAAPMDANVTVGADGSYIMVTENVDEEDGSHLRHEYHYDTNDRLLQIIHRADGVEFFRDEYQYDRNGLLIRKAIYHDGELSLTLEYQYNEEGLLVRMDRTSTEPERDYVYEHDENGMEISKEINYRVKTETYRYNDRGLLAETVAYADGKEYQTDTYDYDANGYVLPSTDTYEYVYNAEGVLQGIWLIYEDQAAGMALLRSRTVYVTPENARQLQDIMRAELSWF